MRDGRVPIEDFFSIEEEDGEEVHREVEFDGKFEHS